MTQRAELSSILKSGVWVRKEVTMCSFMEKLEQLRLHMFNGEENLQACRSKKETACNNKQLFFLHADFN